VSTGPVDGGLLGPHVNDGGDGGVSVRCCGALHRAALAGQHRLAAGEGPARVGAALFFGTGIVVTDGGRQRIQALIQRGPIGGVKVARKAGHARTSGIEVHIPVVLDLGRYPHPGWIELGYPQIHPVAQFRPGQLHPLRDVTGDRLIELRHDLLVNVVGAADDAPDPARGHG
jgi:hypothetical protein